ncbi:MAG: S-adenosylmethionine tRNA ribosyltransferase [Bacteroidetes bacterium 4572_112]|nr:MAG: S-adenosylmethionine tRNA ribosyltransferase [Bacteroidetes bacterium 4572_112]
MHPKDISIADYNYPLPDDRIAQHPVAQRDKSKLLISNNGDIQESVFENIADFLPKDSLIVYNNTKVIRARMQFRKPTGAKIEIFILEPLSPTVEIQNSFSVTAQCEWKCLVGGAKKWKQGELSLEMEYNGARFTVYAEKAETIGNSFRIKFRWEPVELTFSDVLIATGSIPLPPYMKRDTEQEDVKRYQTIYAKHQGSVAAPTAGLHFTTEVEKSLANKGIKNNYVSLHVGAGTFKPVSAEKIEGHEMHTEQVVIQKQLVEDLLQYSDKKIIAVGTTTTRSLESIYWYGVQLLQDMSTSFHIKQWDPYDNEFAKYVTVERSLKAVIEYMDANNIEELHGDTQIIIAPSYEYKIVDILITNFHQPKSTLLLLVSAFYGEQWKESYDYALDNEFRFLSYGDSCLFFKK